MFWTRTPAPHCRAGCSGPGPILRPCPGPGAVSRPRCGSASCAAGPISGCRPARSTGRGSESVTGRTRTATFPLSGAMRSLRFARGFWSGSAPCCPKVRAGRPSGPCCSATGCCWIRRSWTASAGPAWPTAWPCPGCTWPWWRASVSGPLGPPAGFSRASCYACLARSWPSCWPCRRCWPICGSAVSPRPCCGQPSCSRP